MKSDPFKSTFLLVMAGLVFCLGATSCALRATTDFGPGETPAHRSVSAGAGPFQDLLDSDRHAGTARNVDPATSGTPDAAGSR